METVPIPVPPMICPQCHQPTPPMAYYCPNCGKKLSDPPFSTSIGTQLWIYALSLALPILCFLVIKYWPGFKYAKSKDPKVKQVGVVAITLLVLSTIVTYWLVAVWIGQAVQSSVNSVGGLGGSLLQ